MDIILLDEQRCGDGLQDWLVHLIHKAVVDSWGVKACDVGHVIPYVCLRTGRCDIGLPMRFSRAFPFP